MNELESCPLCYALPCDWAVNPHDKENAMAFTLATKIREILGVYEKPMLDELPGLLRKSLNEHYNQGLRDAANIADDRGDSLNDDEEYEDAEDSCFCIASDIRGLIRDTQMTDYTKYKSPCPFTPSEDDEAPDWYEPGMKVHALRPMLDGEDEWWIVYNPKWQQNQKYIPDDPKIRHALECCDGKWRHWKGSECPLPDDCLVEVNLINHMFSIAAANSFAWGTQDVSMQPKVAAYMLVSTEQALKPMTDWTADFYANKHSEPAPEPVMESCSSCRFFCKSDVMSNFDLCRRYPEFISKQSDSWCGEYQLKEGLST